MIATEFEPPKAPTGWQAQRTVPPPQGRLAEEQNEPQIGLQRRLRDFSAAYPGLWIAGAISLGVILGCIVKRR